MERSKFRERHVHPDIQTYNDIDDIPINNSQRRCTDILCTIVGLGFTIVLAVFAILLFNRAQYEKEVFPADSDGMTCGHEYPGYNYLYFANPAQLKDRVCVIHCPSATDTKLKCKKTSKLDCNLGGQMQYYDNQAVINEYGRFCMPTDEGQKAALNEQMKSYSRQLYYNSVNTIKKSLVVVAVASVIFMLLVQCFPSFMNYAAVVLGTLSLIGLAVTIVIYPSNINAATRFIVLGITILFLIILLITFISNFAKLGLNTIFLKESTKFVCARPYLFLLPVVFLGLLAAFLYFQALQYRSFWSFGELTFNPETDLYPTVTNATANYILSALQIIQIYWGAIFLKEAFNYLVSAEAVQWYHGSSCACCNGLFTLVCKHLGSVIACSFMTAFFGLWDFIFDFLIPDTFTQTQNPCLRCLSCFAGYFDLVRSDSMAFVYMTGNAYCNSARYCEYLTNKSDLTRGSQTTSRIYRFTSHFAVAGVVTILAFWVISDGAEVSISGLMVLLLLSLAVSAFFIQLHADSAEAIIILFLTEEEMGKRGTLKDAKMYGDFSTKKHEDLAQEVEKYKRNTP